MKSSIQSAILKTIFQTLFVSVIVAMIGIPYSQIVLLKYLKKTTVCLTLTCRDHNYREHEDY